MKVYVGQTRSVELIHELGRLGFGECTLRGELPPKRLPWFYDNGAFSDFTRSRCFNTVRFVRDQWRIRNLILEGHPPPDFIVLPDLVGGGAESLALSATWLFDPLIEWMAPTYLAVQDGMSERAVGNFLDRKDIPRQRDEAEPRTVGGIFVGGTLEWKVETGAGWVRFAHDRNLPCHIGRAGAVDRIGWAIRIGADSIDSCVPLWSRRNLERFVAALDPAPQLPLQLSP